jgi:uncharacterized membrane protein YidH (DUF202 family)
MELFGVLVGLSAVALVIAALALAILLPAFWVWMLADAIIREASAYPSRDNVEKIVWIVLMVTLQPVVVLYFFLVWRTQPRVSLRTAVTETTAPVA